MRCMRIRPNICGIRHKYWPPKLSTRLSPFQFRRQMSDKVPHKLHEEATEGYSAELNSLTPFRPNTTIKEPYTDDEEAKIEAFMTERPLFVNPIDQYQIRYNVDVDELLINQNSYESYKTFEEICENNENFIPFIGSLVEFIDPITNKNSFAMVLKPAESKFNENYNKLTVLTVDNELINISPQFVTLHLNRIFNCDWISSLQVMENRFNDQYSPRIQLLSMIKQFLNDSTDLMTTLENKGLFNRVFSQFSYSNEITCITLPQIITSFQLEYDLADLIYSSYFYQSVLLMSCHLHLANNPSNWLVSSCYRSGNLSNIILKGCSNMLPSLSLYMVNSSENSLAIQKLESELHHKNSITKYETFLKSLEWKQNSDEAFSFENLNYFFHIWEGKQFRTIIDVLKFTIVYPHPHLIEVLEKLSIFNEVSPKSIYRFLKRMKIYDNDKNQLTDIYLSANIQGQQLKYQLSSSNEMDKTYTQRESHHMLQLHEYVDRFNHIRQRNKYYSDHIIYALPFNKTSNDVSFLGVSLEKINARKYKINLHIPDITTRLAPNTNLFHNILSNSNYMKSLINLTNGNAFETFFRPVTEHFGFKNQSFGQRSETTCMTISYEYNTFDSNPFHEASGKINFSFDSLDKVKIKPVNWEDLEKLLEAKSHLNPFKLFKYNSEAAKQFEDTYDEYDHHNLRFLYSVMSSHFKVRNLDGAANNDPSIAVDATNASNLTRSLSYDDELKETIVTKLDTLSQGNPKSKFFINEINMFAGRMTSLFCTKNDIPIYKHVQDLVDNQTFDEIEIEQDVLNDEVLVSHSNVLLPEYFSSSFYQTLIAKEQTGYLSLPAFLIGKNYLSRSKLIVSDPNSKDNYDHIAFGIKGGFIKILDVFNDAEAMLNQLQILSYINVTTSNFQNQSIQIRGKREFPNKQSYNLKSWGYNVESPLSLSSLQHQLQNLNNSDNLIQFLGAKHKNFWTLKMLEQRLKEPTTFFDSTTRYSCIITSVGFDIPAVHKKLCRAYCLDLSLEIDILIDDFRSVTVGTNIYCDKVVYIDAITGQCVLQDEVSSLSS